MFWVLGHDGPSNAGLYVQPDEFTASVEKAKAMDWYPFFFPSKFSNHLSGPYILTPTRFSFEILQIKKGGSGKNKIIKYYSFFFPSRLWLLSVVIEGKTNGLRAAPARSPPTDGLASPVELQLSASSPSCTPVIKYFNLSLQYFVAFERFLCFRRWEVVSTTPMTCLLFWQVLPIHCFNRTSQFPAKI